MKKILAYLLCLVLLLTACHKSEVATSAVKPLPTLLRIDLQEGDLPSLHPHDLMIYLRGIGIAKSLFESLTRIDAQGEVELAGAQSVDISPDALTYTFHLRENHWSDGKPVTAQHYAHSWREALSPTSTCSRADLLYVLKGGEQAKRGELSLNSIGVTALDDLTLQVELEHPSPFFLELVAQPICAPLRRPLLHEVTEFNGPFMMDFWDKGSQLRLKPNPHFWNHSKVSLTGIDLFMIQDVGTAFSLYERGEIDWLGVPFCPLSTELIDHFQKKEALLSHPVDRAFWIFLNTEHPLLCSASIRQALSLAIDREEITKHILIGGSPLQKPYPEVLISTAPTHCLKKDLREAQALLQKGLKDLGYQLSSLPPLVISYSQQANRKQLAEYLQQAWGQELGLKVQLLPQEWNVLRSHLEKGLFEISGAFEAAFYRDPLELLQKLTTRNPCNFPQWVNPAYSKAVLAAKNAKTSRERQELIAQAEEILSQELPFIPISSDLILYTHPKQLKGYAFDYVGAVDFSYASFQQ